MMTRNLPKFPLQRSVEHRVTMHVQSLSDPSHLVSERETGFLLLHRSPDNKKVVEFGKFPQFDHNVMKLLHEIEECILVEYFSILIQPLMLLTSIQMQL